jgi:hypothetical protein
MSDNLVVETPAVATATTTTATTTTTTKSKRLKKEKVEKPKKEKVPKAEKPKKEKVDKYNGFKVPPKSGPRSTRCVNHIYDMIKEAAPTLLERDDVRIAFNNFVDCLRKYDTEIESWVPPKYNRYNLGIKIDINNKYSHLKGLNCRFKNEYSAYNNPDIKKTLTNDTNVILNTYKPLYELIKRNVVPYMEIKDWELKSKKDIDVYHKYMEKLERDIKTYEQCVNQTRKTICEYAQKCLALQTPPNITTFD